MTFTTRQPASGQTYSTIYVGGDDAAFADYGRFLGLVEKVDVGNVDQGDKGFVFSEALFQDATERSVATLADIIVHEIGHLLGYAHTEDRAEILDQDSSGLDAVAAVVGEEEPNDESISANPLALDEDPVGSGKLLGWGTGTISPTGDIDWWRFSALGGDWVSISVDAVDSNLEPRVELHDGGGLLTTSMPR